jgi:cell division protein FtsW
MLSWLYRPQNSLSRLDKSILGQWWWTVDRGMLTVFLLMAVLGVVMVASASPPVAAHLKLPHFHFLVRHVIILIPALIMMIGVSLLDQRQIWRLATLLLLGSFAAMIMVLVAGAEIKGAQRWIRILGFSLQPSEFAKPAFIIVGAWMMAFQKQKNADEISTEKQGRFKVIDALNANWSVACVYGILITLLLLQPDLGMTIVVTVVFATQIFLAGLPFRYLLHISAFITFRAGLTVFCTLKAVIIIRSSDLWRLLRMAESWGSVQGKALLSSNCLTDMLTSFMPLRRKKWA